MKRNYTYKCFIRSTSNMITSRDMYQVSLPPHVWKKMGWKVNENVQMVLIRDEDTQYIKILKDK